jgi:hypothetical protein
VVFFFWGLFCFGFFSSRISIPKCIFDNIPSNEYYRDTLNFNYLMLVFFFYKKNSFQSSIIRVFFSIIFCGSQYVPQVPNVFPNMFSIAPHFYLICLAKCCPPFTYIGGPKGRNSIYLYNILGWSSFSFIHPVVVHNRNNFLIPILKFQWISMVDENF